MQGKRKAGSEGGLEKDWRAGGEGGGRGGGGGRGRGTEGGREDGEGNKKKKLSKDKSRAEQTHPINHSGTREQI